MGMELDPESVAKTKQRLTFELFDAHIHYNSKLNKPFKVSNKLKGKGYDPVTTSDIAFEKFIRLKIKKNFPKHQIIGEEYGQNVSNSEFSWVIDPIDGTRSFVIGKPTWSNLISLIL